MTTQLDPSAWAITRTAARQALDLCMHPTLISALLTDPEYREGDEDEGYTHWRNGFAAHMDIDPMGRIRVYAFEWVGEVE